MIASPLRSFHASNLLTYASLAAGLAAVAAAMRGNAPLAGGLIALGVIADTFDGRFARSFTRDANQRSFGGQIDSLADAIAFGAGPAIAAVLLASNTAPALLAAAFAFAACAITRLAHFNLHHDEVRGFIGVPVPVAALIWSTTLLFDPTVMVTTIVLGGCAVAMVAPLEIPRPSGAGLMLFALWPASVAVRHLF